MRDSFIKIALILALPVCEAGATLPYSIVDTGQTKCYNNRNEIVPPNLSQPFYGQDAQFHNHPASYTRSADGQTIYDNVTGLTWQSSPQAKSEGGVSYKDKLTWSQARALPAKLNAARFGGFSDWRLPTIKELYSLILFSGIDVSGPNITDNSRLTPFIDTRFFKFAYGDISAGERTIDSQWASSTLYVANPNQMFGVNFADGRIKGYGLTMPGRGDKTFFAICVRGNTNYGKNDFHDNGDGSVTDRATGLIWSKNDSGKGMNWEDALAWVQARNAANYLHCNNWRLPNAKELQSIVDYSRSPATSHSAAIDPVFNCAQITNEIGQTDYPYYWTGTTHAGMIGAGAAVYIAFGRAAGWPPGMPPDSRFGSGPDPGGPPPGGPGFAGPPDFGRPGSGSGNYHYTDIHGAGAQRSDPKVGDPLNFPHGRGPQGDVIRIYNYVRLVRNAAQ